MGSRLWISVVSVSLLLLIAGCGGKAKVQYPMVDDSPFQVRTFKVEKHRYNAVGSRAERGTQGMTDPEGEIRRIMEAIQATMNDICDDRRAVLRAREIESLVIAINTLYDCIEA